MIHGSRYAHVGAISSVHLATFQEYQGLRLIPALANTAGSSKVLFNRTCQINCFGVDIALSRQRLHGLTDEKRKEFFISISKCLAASIDAKIRPLCKQACRV